MRTAQPGKDMFTKPFMGMLMAALFMCISTQAHSTVVHNVNYNYFIVGGNTAAEIYRVILSRGPAVGGSKALASVATTASQSGRVGNVGGFCRAIDYKVNLNSLIKRPRIANEKALPPADLQLWRQFSVFIAAHEERHVQLWSSCAADLVRKVNTIRVPSCSEASAKVRSLWNQMLARCNKLHRSFDVADAKALMKQPFMRKAIRAAKR